MICGASIFVYSNAAGKQAFHLQFAIFMSYCCCLIVVHCSRTVTPLSRVAVAAGTVTIRQKPRVRGVATHGKGRQPSVTLD